LKYHEEDNMGPFSFFMENWPELPHQEARKTWSHMCVHLTAKDVVFQGKVSSPSKCNVFMGWHLPRTAEHLLRQESWKQTGLSPAVTSSHSCSPAHLSRGLETASCPALTARSKKGMPSDEC